MVLYDKGLGYNDIVHKKGLKTYASHRESLGKDMFITSSAVGGKAQIHHLYSVMRDYVDKSTISTMDMLIASRDQLGFDLTEILQ